MLSRTLPNATIVGLFSSMPEAQSAIQELMKENVPTADIGFLATVTRGKIRRIRNAKPDQIERTTPVPENINGLGGVVDLVAVSLPGIGPALASGHCLTSLQEDLDGGVDRCLMDLGVSRRDAAGYEEGVRRGFM